MGATTTKPKAPTPVPIAVSSAQWAEALLKRLGKPVTPTNIANIQRWIEVESAGNEAGFLRDNNPLNLNTYTSAHGSLPGGTIVPEFGIYVQTFPTIEAGIDATAKQIGLSPSLMKVLDHSGSAALFGGALSTSAWSSGSYANATKFPTITPFTGSSKSGSGVSGDVLHFFNDLLGGGDPFFGSSTENDGAGSDVSTAVGAGESIAGATESVGKFLGDITNPTTLKNVGIFVAGVALVVGGLVLFFAQTKTAKSAVGVAEKVA